MTARYIVGDTRDVLATLPDNSVDEPTVVDTAAL